MTTKQAKTGGEFYEGGQFINTIPENAKVEGSRAAKPRKVQVEPGVFVIDARYPIFALVGSGANYADRSNPAAGMVPYLPAFARGDCNGRTLAEVQTACDRYNAGERWL